MRSTIAVQREATIIGPGRIRGRPLTLFVIGASYRTTTSAVLGKLGATADRFRERIRTEPNSRVGIDELVTLSTCNRTEIYVVARGDVALFAEREIWGALLAADGNVHHSELYCYRGRSAARHFCRVAAGLDSLVLGEREIAGQSARALHDAVVSPEAYGIFRHLRTAARRAVAQVQTHTSVGRHRASMASVAVDLAMDSLGELSGRRVLIVGAGRTSRGLCRMLAKRNVGSLTVVNRTVERAVALAESVGGKAAPLSTLEKLLESAEVVITATSAAVLLVDLAMVACVLAKRDPTTQLVFVDLSVPNNVEPHVQSCPGVVLFTADDIRKRVDRNLTLRHADLAVAEELSDEAADEFCVRQAIL